MAHAISSLLDPERPAYTSELRALLESSSMHQSLLVKVRPAFAVRRTPWTLNR